MKENPFHKKIAFVTHMYYPANLTGSCITVDNLAKAFRDKGHDVSVIVSRALEKKAYYIPFFSKRSDRDFEIMNGIKIYRLRCNYPVSLFAYIFSRFLWYLLPRKMNNRLNFMSRGPYLIGLYALLKKNLFDVIFSSPLPYYLTKQVADSIKNLDKRPRFILQPEYHFMLPYYKNLEFKTVFDTADIIKVWSEAEKEAVKKRFRVSDNKIKIITNGLAIENYKDDRRKRKKIIEKYGLKGKKIILYAGVKSKFKGPLILLRAINNLYKKDNSYILIGIGETTLDWKWEKLFVDKHCVLDLGYVSNQIKEIIFDISDIYCMPSISEALGITYLEAWYRKKPVIAAKFSLTEEIIGSCKGGLMVEFGNQLALENAIELLFKNNRLAKRLGKNGFEALKKKYLFNQDFSKCMDSLI